MGPKEEVDILLFQRKARRAKRFAVIFAFLFALLWAVNVFFVWLFLGAMAYCIFLIGYYQSHTKAKKTEARQEPNLSGVDQGSQRLKKGIVFFIVGGLGIAIVVIIMNVLSSSSAWDDPSIRDPSETQTKESAPNDANSIDTLTNLGNDLYTQGKYDSALIFYDKVLLMDPANQSAFYDKALVYYAKNCLLYTSPSPRD